MVNVLVDHSEPDGSSVVFEDNPTYQNLLGRVEHIAQFGTLVTDFTLIKPGALHRANGGYLLLDVHKLLMQPFAWEGLKRALSTREIRIESLGQMYSLVSTVSLEPEPIPLDLKVVLFGERIWYYLLYAYDPGFPRTVQGGGGLRGGDSAQRRNARPLRAADRHHRAPRRTCCRSSAVRWRA